MCNILIVSLGWECSFSLSLLLSTMKFVCIIFTCYPCTFKNGFLFMYVSVCMSVYNMCIWRLQSQEESVRFPGNGAINGCEPPHGCSKSSLGPLKEQTVLFTTESPPKSTPSNSEWCVWLKHQVHKVRWERFVGIVKLCVTSPRGPHVCGNSNCVFLVILPAPNVPKTTDVQHLSRKLLPDTTVCQGPTLRQHQSGSSLSGGSHVTG